MHLGELLTWGFEYEVLLPESEPDQTFVVKYHMFYPDEVYDPKDYEAGDQFRFFITTIRLISFSSNFKLVLQTDGTYKLL